MRVFSAPMTAADQRKAAAFERDFDKWKKSLTAWELYIHGAAEFWAGPKPRKPGAPPVPPHFETVAHQAAGKVGAATIYGDPEQEVDKLFKCTGRCSRGECHKTFEHAHGDGYSTATKMTYCVYTVRGHCAC